MASRSRYRLLTVGAVLVIALLVVASRALAASVENDQVTEGSSGQRTVQVAITGPFAAGTSIPYVTRDGTATTADGDYLALDGNAICPPVGNDCGRLFIRATIYGDTKSEPNEQFFIDVTGIGTSTFTIVSDDAAPPVEDMNVAPVLTGSATLGATEDTSTTQQYAASDGDSTALTYAVSNPPNGSASISPLGLVSYQGDGNFAGGDSFTVSVADGEGGSAAIDVTVTVAAVNDSPVIPSDSIPGDQTLEATSDGGAEATFIPPTATDVDTGDTVAVSCTSASGAIFPIGTTTVVCTATDGSAATDTTSFTITVRDRTAPVIDADSVPGDPTVTDGGTVNILAIEATGADTAVQWEAVTATDIVDGTVEADCVAASGATFPVGDNAVRCDATDEAGNTGPSVTFFVRMVDSTAPSVTVPASITVEATSASGATVRYTATADDAVDGSISPVCAPASGTTFGKGSTTVGCTATDTAGNDATASFTVRVVDTDGPTITLEGGPLPNQIYTHANLPPAPTCTTSDAASAVIQCRVFGYSSAPGRHTMTIRARDADGNATIVTRSYTVTGASRPTATPTITPTQMPVPPTVTPVPPQSTVTPVSPQPTATPVPAQPTVTPVPPQPTATPGRPVTRPTATPVSPVVQPTSVPTRPPRR